MLLFVCCPLFAIWCVCRLMCVEQVLVLCVCCVLFAGCTVLIMVHGVVYTGHVLACVAYRMLVDALCLPVAVWCLVFGV